MGFYNFLLNKIRNRRFSSTNQTIPQSNKIYIYGSIVSGPYKNYKHDPNPLAFVMFSDNKYTHGINLNYLGQQEKAWLARSIYMIKKYQQQIDARTFYNYLKQQQISIVKKAYRIYFTGMTDYKMVSAGFTDYDKMCYKSNNQYIAYLNKILNPQSLQSAPQKVSYSSTELRERIIEGMNTRTIPIHSATVSATRSAYK